MHFGKITFADIQFGKAAVDKLHLDKFGLRYEFLDVKGEYSGIGFGDVGPERFSVVLYAKI
jgi:hypothetical protein